jgi:hypothetical protein
MQALIAHVADQDARIAQLCQAVEAMGSQKQTPPTPIDTDKLNKMVD